MARFESNLELQTAYNIYVMHSQCFYVVNEQVPGLFLCHYYLTLPKFWALIQHMPYAGEKCMCLAECICGKDTVAHHCRNTKEMPK